MRASAVNRQYLGQNTLRDLDAEYAAGGAANQSHAPRAVSRVEPVYPLEPEAGRMAGVVVIRTTIDKGGNVYKAESVSGPPQLVPIAVETVKQWKYRPYLIGLDPVEVETTVEISFTL
jgi:TonB family protein